MVKILLYILTAVYPVLVFCFLVILKIPVRYFSVFVVFAAFVFFLGATSKKKSLSRVLSLILLGGTALACFVSNSAVFLKLYPVLMNAVMLGVFGFTLFSPPPMIFRFAVLQDKSIRGSLAEKRIEGYCRKVTIVWCAFFIVNGGAALFTVLSGSDLLWSVYNGGVSYILMGTLFAGEFIVRRISDRKMPKVIPLSKITANSRPPETVLCYEGRWSDGVRKTWKDFLEGTARLRLLIEKDASQKWILHADDCWYFLVSLAALLQCKRDVLLTANISPAYIAEIRQGGIAFLTDQNLSQAEASGDIHFLPSLLSEPASAGVPGAAPPPINADETVIMMYTSGTTGRPKAVRQRLTEFEIDNAFILSKWGGEWLKRRVCSTVSQHHIYGILYTILLPFAAAVPFRRRRIEFPEEFEKLDDASYMVVTVPAFLKRAVEVKSADAVFFAEASAAAAIPEAGGAGPAPEARYPLKDPWIYTSGGVLTPDVAEKTDRVFGFWPLEVYGSTETSGIAWRQSKNGLEWTPFDNAKLTLNDEGRLVVRSPYIKDPAGFTTGDLADMLSDGRFLLRGRADSIVKIEEKRISLPEVEARILQSGLVSDVCVIALAGRRQYLAAVIALNGRGKEQFRGLDKFEINRWFREYLLQFFESVVLPKKWRYIDIFPLDAQGKKKRLEMEALFAREDRAESPDSDEDSHSDIIAPRRIVSEKVLEKTEERALLEFTVPPESDYFDVHFPILKVLPALAQFELAIRYADRYFKTGLSVRQAKRLKFSAIVRPNAPLRLELNHKGETVSFVLTSPDGETVYSSGSFTLGAE
ncbi:MAG: AMP-binding protein [Treponema sp.]|jgi:acyl-coenzyme A synthetase/AMP-(fatty) acid ligase/uncharacterized membrane protein|nr:AMP-binding protein [Treponema sp.]